MRHACMDLNNFIRFLHGNFAQTAVAIKFILIILSLSFLFSLRSIVALIQSRRRYQQSRLHVIMIPRGQRYVSYRPPHSQPFLRRATCNLAAGDGRWRWQWCGACTIDSVWYIAVAQETVNFVASCPTMPPVPPRRTCV